MESLPRKTKYWLFALVVAWFTYSMFILVNEGPRTGTDVFLFKQAGVNYAKTGKLLVKNLPHTPYGYPVPYSYYPPIYPLLFGVWTKIYGIGMTQSLFFDWFIRVLRSTLMLVLLFPYLRRRLQSERNSSRGLIVVSVILLMSLLSGDGDRPDELAMVFGLASWWVVRRVSDTYVSTMAGGVLLGLCGATSPACGVLFGLGFFPPLGGFTSSFVAFFISALFALTTFLGVTVPFQVGSESWSQMSKQLPLSLFPYKAPFLNGNTLGDFTNTFYQALMKSFSVGWAYLFCTACLLGIASYVWRHRTGEKRVIQARAIFRVAPVFFLVSIFVWTLQPYYYWFVSVILTVGILSILLGSENGGRFQKVTLVLLLTAYAPLLWGHGKMFLSVLQRGDQGSSESVAKSVLGTVRGEHTLAVSADQYFTFLKYREVDNVDYVCYRLKSYDFVYETPTSTRIDRDQVLSCTAARKCFEPVLDLRHRHSIRIAGFNLPYRVRDNGGILFKNTRCKTSQKEVVDLADENQYLSGDFVLKVPSK